MASVRGHLVDGGGQPVDDVVQAAGDHAQDGHAVQEAVDAAEAAGQVPAGGGHGGAEPTKQIAAQLSDGQCRPAARLQYLLHGLGGLRAEVHRRRARLYQEVRYRVTGAVHRAHRVRRDPRRYRGRGISHGTAAPQIARTDQVVQIGHVFDHVQISYRETVRVGCYSTESHLYSTEVQWNGDVKWLDETPGR